MEQRAGSKLEKDSDKAVYCHSLGDTVTLGDSQDEIKIPRRNNNFRYADDITLMAENKEELKSFLMKVKEESEIAGLKLNIQKTNMMVSSPIPSCK